MSAAIEAMKKAAEKLAKIASGSANDVSPSAPEPASTPPEDAEAQRFYRDLEQRGELVDIDETTDVALLPPNVTHVRYPDGRVRRVGFSSPSHPTSDTGY